jgi:hypothetical protein
MGRCRYISPHIIHLFPFQPSRGDDQNPDLPLRNTQWLVTYLGHFGGLTETERANCKLHGRYCMVLHTE